MGFYKGIFFKYWKCRILGTAHFDFFTENTTMYQSYIYKCMLYISLFSQCCLLFNIPYMFSH